MPLLVSRLNYSVFKWFLCSWSWGKFWGMSLNVMEFENHWITSVFAFVRKKKCLCNRKLSLIHWVSLRFSLIPVAFQGSWTSVSLKSWHSSLRSTHNFDLYAAFTQIPSRTLKFWWQQEWEKLIFIWIENLSPSLGQLGDYPLQTTVFPCVVFKSWPLTHELFTWGASRVFIKNLCKEELKQSLKLRFKCFPETWCPVHSHSASRHASRDRIWHEIFVRYGLRPSRFSCS